MQSVWGVHVPAGAEEFPGPASLRRHLRRCSCGQITFLPLPCANCGGQESEPLFQYARNMARSERVGRWFLAAVYMLAAGYVAFRIFPPLALLVVITAVAALVVDLCRRTPEQDTCFWLFHDSARGRKKLPMADISCLGALTDAYDLDLGRLGQILGTGSGPECTERVFRMTQDLAGVYHNRRTSALLAQCLASLPLSEGICVDLEQICTWLEPEDISPEVLQKLAECAGLTCLPPGEQTARFTLRCCARRVQAHIEASVRGMDRLLNEIPDLVSEGELALNNVLPEEERRALSALWRFSAGWCGAGTAPDSAKPKFPEDTAIGNLPEGSSCPADYWLWYAWSDPDGAVFRDVNQTLCDQLATILMKERRGEQSD